MLDADGMVDGSWSYDGPWSSLLPGSGNSAGTDSIGIHGTTDCIADNSFKFAVTFDSSGSYPCIKYTDVSLMAAPTAGCLAWGCTACQGCTAGVDCGTDP